MNLLLRLVAADLGTVTSGGTGDAAERVPRFFTSRRFLWELSLDGEGRLVGDGLASVRDAADPKGRRGAAHDAPSLTRSSGIAPLLGADDIQYVLGWADDRTRPARVRRCLEAFAAAVEDWAARDPDDPVARAVATFYREERYAEVTQPGRWSSKDPVFISVDGEPVMMRSSLQQTWSAHALARKASEEPGEAQCLVCGQRRPYLQSLPQTIPQNLVPGALHGAALISVNERIFGHAFKKGLASSPICDQCGEKAVTALRTMASRAGGKAVGANDRYGTLHHPGQRTRLVWWTLGQGFELDQALKTAQAEVIEQLYERVRAGRGRPRQSFGARFCTVTFSGSTARLAINGWIDRPLVDIESNIVDWFDDHAIEPLNQDDGPYVGIYRLFLALGRWEPDRTSDRRYRGRYSTPPSSGNDPHRPPDAQAHLVDAALLGRPLPLPAVLHLVNRIRADGRIDQPRVGLLRLFLNRHAHSTSRPTGHRENTVPGPGLDNTYDDPSYLAGRIMAVLGRIQYTAARSREGRTKGGGLNTTFEDRYPAGAITNPQIAIIQGEQQSAAWLRKLRQTRPAAATALHGQLHDLFARYPARDGLPGRSTSTEQAKFILGYHQQRAHDIRKAKEQQEKNGQTDVGDLPELDEPIGNDDNETHHDEGGTHD